MSEEITPRPTHTVLVARPGPEAPPGRRRGMGIRASMTAGLVIVGVFVGGFGRWAAVAPLESAAIAPGIIGVSTERRTVQHMEGGIVDEILVADGDQVAAGQTLIVFDDTAARALLDLLEGQHRSAVALNARLEAERDNRPAIRWPDWLQDEAVDDGEAAEVMATQEHIFQARAVALANQRAIYQRRIEQLREESAGLEGELEAQDHRQALLAEELEGVRELVARGLEPKPRLLQMERAETQIVGDRVRNQARIGSIGQTIDETRLVIDQLGNVRLAEVGGRAARGGDAPVGPARAAGGGPGRGGAHARHRPRGRHRHGPAGVHRGRHRRRRPAADGRGARQRPANHRGPRGAQRYRDHRAWGWRRRCA